MSLSKVKEEVDTDNCLHSRTIIKIIIQRRKTMVDYSIVHTAIVYCMGIASLVRLHIIITVIIIITWMAVYQTRLSFTAYLCCSRLITIWRKEMKNLKTQCRTILLQWRVNGYCKTKQMVFNSIEHSVVRRLLQLTFFSNH